MQTPGLPAITASIAELEEESRRRRFERFGSPEE
jgi:hypothetical protein